VRKNTLSVVGLGKLGLPLASVFAKKGYLTLGIDINKKVIDSVNKGMSPFYEPNLDELISKVGGKKLVCTNDYDRPIQETDITYILTNTPSKPDGSFSNKHIESALISLSKRLKYSEKDYHLFVISSTVMPGSITESFIPVIQKYSGRELNKGFGIGYCPDFVALGDVINGFISPEIIVIGESQNRVGDIIQKIHHNITDNDPHIGRMSLPSAEIAKISLNSYITMKISFVNNLANICEKIPFSDVDHITNAIGHDKRISPYYFKAGMSYGGTCFPRDTFAFNKLLSKVDLSTDLFDAVNNINDYQDKRLLDLVLTQFNKTQNKGIVILGMSFKLGTPVIEGSAGVKLVKKILAIDPKIDITVIDPMSLKNCEILFGNNIKYSDNIGGSLRNCNVAVLINNEQIFIDEINTLGSNNNITIIDCWRILKHNPIREKINIIDWGKHRGN
jgi:UDPglucose 6-dehydrogenase